MQNNILEKNINSFIDTLNLFKNDVTCLSNFNKIIEISIDTLQNKNIIFTAGNGGSCATAEHLTAELLGRYLKERKSLPSISLAGCTSTLTAISNDYGYKESFSRSFNSLSKNGDLLICFSTSGKSENLIESAKVAKSKSIKVISFTSKRTCPLDNLSDIKIKVPSTHTPFIQDIHNILIHSLCDEIDNHFLKEMI